VSGHDNNPYAAPATSREPLPKRPYTRFRLFLDVFAIVFASLPLILILEKMKVVALKPDDLLDDKSPLSLALAYLCCLLSVLLFWLVSLIINIVGTVKLRPVSIFGFLLNVASFIAMY
jgi:hypothetical protein